MAVTGPDAVPPAGRAPAGGTGRIEIAAVDLLTERERHADGLVADLCAEIARAGGTDVVGATHWAEARGVRHTAVTVAAGGLDEADLRAAVGRVVDARPAPDSAVRVGSRATGSEDLVPCLDAALAAHRDRSSGRVVVFPGSAAVEPDLPVGSLLDATAIDRVARIAAGDADRATVVRTRGFLRPRWERGALVLHVQEAVGDVLVPFEVPDPTPCCAAHA